MSERLAFDIAADLRAPPGPWPSARLLCEAADKLDGLIELLANAERERDEALAEVGRLRASQLPDDGELADTIGTDYLGRPCTIYVPPEDCTDPAHCRVHRGAYTDQR